METIYFKGTPVHTYGDIPAVGSTAPDFTLTGNSLQDIRLSDYKGKRVVLNVFPSLDTPVCAMSVRKFNQEAAKLDNTQIICISMDLPFAQSRFCSAEGIDKLVVASAFRAPGFVKNYGLEMVDGPIAGLLARAVIIVDESGKVIYSDLVSEVTDEPDYKAAISVLK